MYIRMGLGDVVRFLITGLFFTVLLSACTRKGADSTDVRLNFSSKSQGTLSDELDMIIINVSGPGISSPIYYQWSKHSCENCTAPSEIVLTVPGGSDRLIQYLGVYESSASAMIFKYGDALKSLSQPTETVDITAMTIGSSTIQGHVFGRYLNGAAEGGPSGTLVAQFVPPNNRPPMVVMQSRMFSGWFSLMLLDGDARFNYLLNGAPLYTSVNLDSPEFAASSRVTRIRIPAYERERDANSREPVGEGRMILGFFGPAASSQIACYDNRANLSVMGAYLPAPSTANLEWDGTSPDAAAAGPLGGGQGYNPTGTGSTCHNTATEFTDHVVFYQDQLSNGHDSVAGAKPPFQAYSVSGSNMQFIEAVPDSATSTVQLNWKYLPDVTSGPLRVAGVTPLRRDGPNTSGGDDLYEDGGVACSRLFAKGFYQAGPDVLTSTGQIDATTTLNGVADMANVKIVLCPFIEANGRQFLDAGLEVYSGGSFYGPTLGLKIMGTSLTTSRLYGPALSQPVTLLKNAFLNGFHSMAISLGGDRFLTQSQMQTVQASVDDGATWTNIDKSEATFTSTGAPVVVGLIPATSGNTLGMALGGSPDKTFKIKVVVDPSSATALGLMQNTIVSPAITLKGMMSCPSPGSLELFDPVNSAVVPSNAMDMFNTVNGTDLDKSMYLRWSGCPATSEILDSISISGTMTPSMCFDHSDFDFDSSNPFLFTITPRDRSGQDCVFSTYTMDLVSPSNAGTDKVTLSGGGTTITHSVTASSLRFLASVDDLTGVSAEKLFIRMAMIGDLTAVKWNAVKVNTDQKLIGAAGVASGSTTWSLGANAANWQSAPTPDNRLSGTTVSVPGSSPFTMITATDAGLSGAVPVATAAPGRSVIAISETTLDGGSPIMVFDNAAELSLGYVPSNYGDFSGKSLKMFNMPSGFPLESNPVFAKVFTFIDPGMNEPRVFVVAAYASNVKYLFGRALGHGSSMTMDWSVGWNSTTDTVYDVMLAQNGNLSFPYIVSNLAGSKYTHWGVFPTHNGSAWGNVNGGNGTAMFYQGSGGISTSLSDGGILGLARCGTQFYVAGRNSSGYLTTQSLPPAAGTLGAVLSSSRSATGATNLACIGMTGSGGSYGRVFITYNKSDGTNAIHGFEGANPFCGGSTDQPLTGLTSLAVTPSSGGLSSVVGLDGMNGVLVAYEAVGYPTKLAFASFNCTGVSLSSGGYFNWGSLAAPASQIKGVTPISESNSGMVMGGGASVGVFGNKSLFYWLKTE